MNSDHKIYFSNLCNRIAYFFLFHTIRSNEILNLKYERSKASGYNDLGSEHFGLWSLHISVYIVYDLRVKLLFSSRIQRILLFL